MRGEDHLPANGNGFFDSFDSVAHLVRHAGTTTPDAGTSRRGETGIAVTAATPAHEADRVAPPTPGRVYRPTVRLPMALLHVVDDGRETGEIVRLRDDATVIGRNEGDVMIPHDVLMSPRHARIERLPEGGWRLTDLGSKTGTFVRVDKARLRTDRTIQVGSTRLQFQEYDGTEAWLLELTPTGIGRRHECHAPVTTIGRAACPIALDDPFVDDIHAEVRRTPRGWRIRNTGANGLWVRIDEPVDLRAPAQFLCGEQRFVFEPLG